MSIFGKFKAETLELALNLLTQYLLLLSCDFVQTLLVCKLLLSPFELFFDILVAHQTVAQLYVALLQHVNSVLTLLRLQFEKLHANHAGLVLGIVIRPLGLEAESAMCLLRERLVLN